LSYQGWFNAIMTPNTMYYARALSVLEPSF